MTSFRFNFSGQEVIKSEDAQDEIQWLECLEVIPYKQVKDLDSIVTHAQMLTCGDIEIGHVVVSEAISNIEDTGFKTAVKLAENEHSDLVTGKYEGGLKIWECTTDLLKYLVDEDFDFKNKKVLDLGCGAGILGIYAFMKSAEVTFQDYNKEVLDYVTIPNVLLNIEEEGKRETEIKRCKFYCGDWAFFNKKVINDFDVIVTSETIYNESNYDKLVSLFKDRLKSDGVVLIAAKTHYFGVGGGTRHFEKIVEKNGLFHSEVCWKSSGGIRREILKLTKKIL